MKWKSHMDKIILEMLANGTPPSSIPGNIMACSKYMLPNYDVVKEVPCVEYIRNLRDVLKLTSKTLSAKCVGESKIIKQVHSNETIKRGKSVLGVVNSVLQEDDWIKTICLVGDIIPENGTAEEQSREIIQSFSDGGKLLENWRD